MNKDNKGVYFILALLLLLAAALRLYHPFQIPFIYDELSALIRTHYSNIHDEIRNGVMLNDTHPAGVQVFLYYWTKLFGYSEIVVKLPFILCGIFSVLYVFRIGKAWFNPTVGLVSAAYLATIEYTIFYSQVARPYSFGLFFSLVMVWHWYKVVFYQRQAKSVELRARSYYKHLLLYVLFSALCAYTHHFSLLFAAIVGLTGLFFVRGIALVKYVTAGICIFILYIPHLHIFLYQLKQGGVGDWLGKPDNAYLLEYIQYILQFSAVAYIIAGLLFLTGIINITRTRKIPSPFYLISLCWFLIPFLLGFFYSKYVNAVIQPSVLLFSFPFMLFTFFGLLPDMKNVARATLVLVICAVNVFVLVSERKYYDIFYQHHYERQVVITDSIYKRVGGSNLTVLAMGPVDSMTMFYVRKYHSTTPYNWVPDSGSKVSLINFLETHKTPYLSFDNIAVSDPLDLPIILNYYPFVVFEKNQQGGTNYILSNEAAIGKSPYVFEAVNDFEKPCQYWGEADKANLITDTNHQIIKSSNHQIYRMDSTREWAPDFSCPLDKITADRSYRIIVSLELYPLETLNDVLLVASFESGGKQIGWTATQANKFIADDTRKKWVKAYHLFQLPAEFRNRTDIKVKVYIWNKGKKSFYMDNFTVRAMQGNPIACGLIEKI